MNLPPQILRILAIPISAIFCLVPNLGFAQSTACDLNQDTSTNIADVQLSVNMVLGLTPCTATIVEPGVCNIVVVQRVVNAAIGGPCVTDVTQHSVQLNWTTSSSPNIVGYNVYRGTTSGGPYSKVNSSLVTGTSYTDNSVQSGSTYYYVVTAVNNSSLESAYSNQATANIPSP